MRIESDVEIGKVLRGPVKRLPCYIYYYVHTLGADPSKQKTHSIFAVRFS